jgi:hypothetical protein
MKKITNEVCIFNFSNISFSIDNMANIFNISYTTLLILSRILSILILNPKKKYFYISNSNMFGQYNFISYICIWKRLASLFIKFNMSIIAPSYICKISFKTFFNHLSNIK